MASSKITEADKANINETRPLVLTPSRSNSSRIRRRKEGRQGGSNTVHISQIMHKQLKQTEISPNTDFNNDISLTLKTSKDIRNLKTRDIKLNQISYDFVPPIDK